MNLKSLLEAYKNQMNENDIVNFSSYAGMYSDGARTTFTGKDGKTHTLAASGDRPRKYYIDGKEVSWDEAKREVGKQKIKPIQGMKESLDEASNSKLAKAMSIINARITKPGQPPKYPSFDSAPEDIKASARNLAKNIKEEADFKVSVEGLPDMYVKGKSSSEVKANLRKVIKKPDAIQSVDRVMPSELKKIFRDKAAGKEELDELAIIKDRRKYSNVKFFETEKGANDFLEKNPEYGVLQADKDGIYVALNKDKGKPVK